MYYTRRGKPRDSPMQERISSDASRTVAITDLEQVSERFWDKVDRGTPDECWEWIAGKHKRGYGHFSVNGENRRAHRVSYALEVEDPGDLYVLHHCDNPSCVNPNHLYAGDQSDNIKDAYDRGRKQPVRVDHAGEKHPQSKLSADDVLEIRERVSNGENHADVAEAFGVSRPMVSMIISGERWGHI